VNFHQLRVFREVATRKSFTGGAEALMLSQPAASLHVRSLEREFAVRLFERSPAGISLTEAGEAVLAGAIAVLETLDHMEQAVAEMRGARRGRIALGANTTGGMYVAPRIIAAFKEAHPEIDVVLQIEPTERIYERLAQNILDMAIVGGPSPQERFEIRRLCADELVLVAHPNHRLLGRAPLSLSDLTQEDLILPEPNSKMRALVEAVFRKAGLAVRPRLVLSGTEALKKAVESSLGVAFVSAYAVEREVALGELRVLAISDASFRRDYELVSLKGRYLTPSLAGFAEYAIDYSLNRLIPPGLTAQRKRRVPTRRPRESTRRVSRSRVSP
jgi:DNA-binding transcriptional LysR family regulator